MSFNHNINTYNTKSAEVIVPMLINNYKVSSVLDIGCGIGTWLSVFRENSVNETLGIDGDYVDRELLHQHIPKDCFIPYDLTQKLDLKKRFDLVISLEVAEHIDEKYAETFVQSLVQHGDVIDDYYSWDGCSRAIHDYLSQENCCERIFQEKGSISYIVKK